MTHLIEKQRISRRPETIVPVKILRHVGAKPLSLPRLPAEVETERRIRKVRLSPLYTYTAAALLAAIAICFVAGAIISMSRGPIAVASLPSDAAVTALLAEFVRVDEYWENDDGGIASERVLSAFEPVSYTVRRGDTVSQIAVAFGLRIDTLVSYNGITDVRSIQAGSVLKIPAFADGESVDGIVYTVRRGDTLGGIALRFGVPLEPMLDANQIESDMIRPGDVLFVPDARMQSVDLRRALGTLFIKPVEGRLTSPFGPRVDPFTQARGMHYGVDWANQEGTPVKASNDGVVSVVGESRLYGKYVVIDHHDQFQSLYGHLSAYSIREGQRVSQGAVIGKVGNTGYSTGPHLHFTLFKNYEPVDPLAYIH